MRKENKIMSLREKICCIIATCGLLNLDNSINKTEDKFMTFKRENLSYNGHLQANELIKKQLRQVGENL